MIRAPLQVTGTPAATRHYRFYAWFTAAIYGKQAYANYLFARSGLGSRPGRALSAALGPGRRLDAGLRCWGAWGNRRRAPRDRGWPAAGRAPPGAARAG